MKLARKVGIILLTLSLGMTPQVILAQENIGKEVEKVQNNQEIRLEDDFYEAINKDWLQSAQLESGSPIKMALTDANDVCQKRIQDIFDEIIKKEKTYSDTATEKKMINLYNNYLNEKERNAQGINPIEGYLKKIQEINSLEEADAFLSDMTMSNITGLYTLEADIDFKEATKKRLYINAGNLLLQEVDCYNKKSEGAEVIEKHTTDYLVNLLKLVGYSDEEANQKVKNCYEFEKKFTGSMLGEEEISGIENIFDYIYNEYTLDQLDEMAPNLNMKGKIQAICGDEVQKVILTEPKWFKALNEVYTEDNIGTIRDYIEVQFLRYAANSLSDDFANLTNEYNNALTGAEGQVSKEVAATSLINDMFSEELGRLYVEKYLSESTKNDVEQLAKEAIDIYKKKIEALDWMEESTKKNAIKKLDHMVIKVGYPDKWEDYSKIEIKSYEQGGSLFENMLAYDEWLNKKAIESLNQPYEKGKFRKSPQSVNATYETDNVVIILAGILQAPFYDPNRSKEANLGGIGVIIGHEISHAFDTNGANLDENGNSKVWWTGRDYANFQIKADQVAAFYSGFTTDNGIKINGNLSVNEDIADIGGMSCALEMMKEIDNANYKEFFESWATCWRAIMTPEYEAYFLQTQPYSTNKIRVNATVCQFQEFYDAYDIKEGDKMYVKPEDRLKIY